MSPARDEHLAPAGDDAEVVDGELVAVDGAGVPAAARSLLPAGPAAQAAAVAATGIVAGAAMVVMARHHGTRKAARRQRKARKQLGEVLATRSFLVDVHLLARD